MSVISKLKTVFADGAWILQRKTFFQKINEIIDWINNIGQPKYKVYSALLSQSGTNAPVATILENTIGNIVWTRAGIGQYTGTLNGIFSINTTFVSNNQASSSSIRSYLDNSPPETIRIISETAPLTPSDNMLFQYPIEIRVYN